jgi:hypothetical protein
LWRHEASHEAARHGQSLISHYCFFSASNLLAQFFFLRQKIIQIPYMALKKDSGNLALRLL